MTEWCSCNKLREAEGKAEALSHLLEDAIEIAECQPWGFFKCRKCEYSYLGACMAVEVLKEKRRIIEGEE